MGLWTQRTTPESKQVKTSASLCEKRDRLEAQLPSIQEEWDRVDEAEVLPAAGRLAAAQFSQNPARLLACRQSLQEGIRRRDEVRKKHNRELGELTAEIETLNTPVISERVQAWQSELQNISSHRAVEVDGKFTDFAADRLRTMFRLRTNADTIIQARAGLLAAIKHLRTMTSRPLSEIIEYISQTEARLSKLDFGKLVTADEAISESRYHDAIEREDPKIQTDATKTNFPTESTASRLLRRTV